nr:molybdate ABC transporter substrate-binding protein [Paenibacillus sp. CECT 9249]
MDTAAGRVANPSLEKVELLVSAAVSMADSLQDIQAMYEKKQPQVALRFSFGASGSLRRQIEQGAPVDLFLSAGEQNMKSLADAQIVDGDDHSALFSNELVVIVPADSALSIRQMEDLLSANVKSVAIGDPRTVPAGMYAQEALASMNAWEPLQSKTVFGNNVRQVLAYVETGNADAGMVYKTDALATDKVKAVLAVDSGSHRPIHYYIGIVKETKHREQAKAFYHFLQGQEARDIFTRYGFGNVR